MQVGELLRTLCELLGIAVWERMRGCLLHSIHSNFDRDASEPSGQLPPGGGSGSTKGGTGDQQASNVGSGACQCQCCCWGLLPPPWCPLLYLRAFFLNLPCHCTILTLATACYCRD